MQISRMPMPAIAPATGPISERIMSPSERPSRRVDRNSTVMSCTAPANTTPARIHSVPGQIAHLRGEHRADQRAGAGDGGEMMAEQHVAVGRHVIEAVVVAIRRRRPLRVDAEHLVGDEQRVEAVGDEVDAHRGDDEPGGVDRLAAGERDDAECDRAQQDDDTPEQLVHHGYSPTPARVRCLVAGAAPGWSGVPAHRGIGQHGAALPQRGARQRHNARHDFPDGGFGGRFGQVGRLCIDLHQARRGRWMTLRRLGGASRSAAVGRMMTR